MLCLQVRHVFYPIEQPGGKGGQVVVGKVPGRGTDGNRCQQIQTTLFPVQSCDVCAHLDVGPFICEHGKACKNTDLGIRDAVVGEHILFIR